MASRREELEQLDKDALIDGYMLLEKRVETLERQMDEFKRALGLKVAKTPSNSSLPPSQEAKGNLKPKQQAKRGPKHGHVGKSRQRQTPDEIVECRVLVCGCCGTDLSELPQHVVGRHQIIDIPPIQPLVREIVRYGRYCPECQNYQRASVASSDEKGQVFGVHLTSLVLYLHHAHPLSYERVQHILRDMLGLEVSLGGLVNMVKRGQAVLKSGAQAIQQRIRAAAVIGSDETGVRVAGQNQWQWVFQTPDWVYHMIDASRSSRVLSDVLDDARPEVWVSDAYSAQMKHPAQHYQLCLAHQIRDLQYLIDTHQCAWASQMQALFRRAIRLHHCRDRPLQWPVALLVQAYRWRLDQLLAVMPASEDSLRLWRRFHKHRHALLFFLERDDVPPTNNASEQALRNSVIYRKVTGGFRTDWGAELYANLISILATARRQGRSLLQTLKMLLAPQPDFSWLRE